MPNPEQGLSVTREWDIPNHAPSLSESDETSLLEAFRSGWISSKGPALTAFEEALGIHFGNRHACVVSSGTAALHLALTAIGIGPGDEVIVPDLTYIAVANAVRYCGATPVFADVHPSYWGLDPRSVEEAVSPETRAIIAVHGFGHPADMDTLISLASRRGITVIEDASQALGATYKGRDTGCLADISVHSFFANKILTTGEGGAVVANETGIRDKVASLRNHSESGHSKYYHEELGFNYRMTNLQAALGLSQLQRLDNILEARTEVLSQYRAALEGLETVSLNPAASWADPVNWMVCARLREPNRTGRIIESLASRNIEARRAFVPLSRQPALVDQARAVPTPVSTLLSQSIVFLPSGSNLDRAAISRVCDVLRAELE